jgi:hypothetical protein
MFRQFSKWHTLFKNNVKYNVTLSETDNFKQYLSKRKPPGNTPFSDLLIDNLQNSKHSLIELLSIAVI